MRKIEHQLNYSHNSTEHLSLKLFLKQTFVTKQTCLDPSGVVLNALDLQAKLTASLSLKRSQETFLKFPVQTLDRSHPRTAGLDNHNFLFFEFTADCDRHEMEAETEHFGNTKIKKKNRSLRLIISQIFSPLFYMHLMHQEIGTLKTALKSILNVQKFFEAFFLLTRLVRHSGEWSLKIK